MSVLVLNLHHNDGTASGHLVLGQNRHDRVIPVFGPFAIEFGVSPESDILSRKPTRKSPLVRFTVDVRSRSCHDVNAIFMGEIEKFLQTFEIKLAFFRLVDKPGNVYVHQIEAVFLHSLEIRFPFR